MKEETVAITTADKGGAMITVTPELIRKLTEEKLSDTIRYRNIGVSDPTQAVEDELISLLDKGVKANFVTRQQDRKTVSILVYNSGKTTISTSNIYKPDVWHINPMSDIYKPDVVYGYPLPKVHKLSQEELAQKKIPPCRFVTDLSRGVTARPDKFAVWQWLGPLAKDYAIDLVKDWTQALQRLEGIAALGLVHEMCVSFGIDVVSLHDTRTLIHEVAFEALDDAIETCRNEEWSEDFIKEWLKDLVRLGFRSAVVKFRDDFFTGVNGILTGRIPSVDLGNISVFYIFKNLLYADEELYGLILLILRFVDDVTGIWNGSTADFMSWFEKFRTTSVARLGLRNYDSYDDL